jgi:ABC-type sugar transport system ATPase subunit
MALGEVMLAESSLSARSPTPVPRLSVREMSKTFPGLKALDRVSLEVHAGEIVAVVGHNGSGKSTLVKLLAGVYTPDPGAEIVFHPADGSSLRESEVRSRLHFIHQDLGLIDTLSTVENLSLGKIDGWRRFGPAHARAERRHARALVGGFGASFDVSRPVGLLSPAERAIVAIARALDGCDGPDHVLVLDESTTAFHGREVERLSTAIRGVAASGAGVVFISHRFDEVLGLADRIVVLRDGVVVASDRASALNHDQLVQLIAGGTVAQLSTSETPPGPAILEARNVAGATVRDATFTLRAGEIVGVSGLLGSGREELAGLLFGARPRVGGEVLVHGRSLRSGDVARAIELGVGYVPADRRREGALMEMSMQENLTLPWLRPFRRRFWRLDVRAEQREGLRWCRTLGLRPAEPDRPLGLFSGGNQQKVVIGKWLRTEPKVLLLEEPTQGVDAGAKAAIYELIIQAKQAGAAILVCSSDTKELVTLSDRVLVLDRGAITSEIPRDRLTEARLVRDELGATRVQSVTAALGGQR